MLLIRGEGGGGGGEVMDADVTHDPNTGHKLEGCNALRQDGHKIFCYGYEI